jgi:hypothetical protein
MMLTKSNFKDHLHNSQMVLERLLTDGMRVNFSKSNSILEEIEYLIARYWITRQGIQYIRNKGKAILNIKAPKTIKEDRTTLVYWYIQPLSRHVVSSQVPLTSLISSKVNVKWHSSYQQAFDKIKKVIFTEVLLCYSDFNKPFHCLMIRNASDHQLGAVIM